MPTCAQLCWIEAFAVGGAEIYRNSETDLDKRCYPGGIFDPLQLASSEGRQARRLKESELRHCRLAMVAFLGYSVQVRTLSALCFGKRLLGRSFAGLAEAPAPWCCWHMLNCADSAHHATTFSQSCLKSLPTGSHPGWKGPQLLRHLACG